MESGACAKPYRPVHFPSKLAVQLQEVAEPVEIRLYRGQISPLLVLLGCLGLYIKGSDGRRGAFSFYLMPRASHDTVTFWEIHCTKQC